MRSKLLVLFACAIAFQSISACSWRTLHLGDESESNVNGTIQMLQGALFEQLDDLSAAKSKQSTVPYDSLGSLWFERYEGTVRWPNPLRADYNMDGEVSVSDLTPIAIHFGADLRGYDAHDPIVYWIDGNGDEEVSIADVTPVAQSFLASIGGFRILTCDNFNPWAQGESGQWSQVAFVNWDKCRIALGTWYEWQAAEIGTYVKIQLEGANLPDNWITSAVIDVGSFIADTEPVSVREFTHPISGDTYEIVDGRVQVRLYKPLSDPGVEAFVKSENLMLLSQTYSETSMSSKDLNIKLPPETSVEAAVRYWRGKYEVVSQVNPVLVFELLDPLQ
jgi:hypothetical protein